MRGNTKDRIARIARNDIGGGGGDEKTKEREKGRQKKRFSGEGIGRKATGMAKRDIARLRDWKRERICVNDKKNIGREC